MLYRLNRDHIDIFLGLYIRATLLVFVFLLILQISQLVEKFWQSFFLLLLTGSLVLQLGFVAYVEIGIKALRKKKISYLELSIMAGLTVVMLFLTLLLLYYNQKRI